MKVLIADDDSSSRELLNGFLSKRGFEITEAEDGQVALDKIYDLQPKVLLLDYSMPKVTGLQVLLALQAKPVEDLKVFMLTGYDEVNKNIAMSDAGAYLIFCKPYDLLHLLDELNKLKVSV